MYLFFETLNFKLKVRQDKFYSVILAGVLEKGAMEDRSESEEICIGKDKANQRSFRPFWYFCPVVTACK